MHYLILVLGVGMFLGFASPTAFADDRKHADMKKHGDMMKPGVSVVEIWARATPGKVPNGAAYGMIKNTGMHGDRLIGIAGDIAKRLEIHEHVMENNIARMRKVDGLEIEKGGMAVLKPGGYHIMLIGLHGPLKKGDSFPLTLMFEKAGKVDVNVEIKAIGAKSGHDGHKHH